MRVQHPSSHSLLSFSLSVALSSYCESFHSRGVVIINSGDLRTNCVVLPGQQRITSRKKNDGNARIVDASTTSRRAWLRQLRNRADPCAVCGRWCSRGFADRSDVVDCE